MINARLAVSILATLIIGERLAQGRAEQRRRNGPPPSSIRRKCWRDRKGGHRGIVKIEPCRYEGSLSMEIVSDGSEISGGYLPRCDASDRHAATRDTGHHAWRGIVDHQRGVPKDGTGDCDPCSRPHIRPKRCPDRMSLLAHWSAEGRPTKFRPKRS